MKIDFYGLRLETESDVEQKFLYPLLTNDLPVGLGYSESDIRTKSDLRKLSIDKGKNKKLYYPDYAIIINGIPNIIIEAKAPNSDLEDALRESRLYATELNSEYPNNINPCQIVVASDGLRTISGYWDQKEFSVEILSEEIDPSSEKFEKIVDLISRKSTLERSNEILKSIKKTSRYFKPTHMLGGKSIINETVGENSFGANVSIEYKYLFNPETKNEKESIVKNAYVNSKRKQSHVAPIDKIIRASIPDHIKDALDLQETKRPNEITTQLYNHRKIRNELCLLIGSVGSGKSTFTDYLRILGLPEDVNKKTSWINLNLNNAPISKNLIYDWTIEQSIKEIKLANPEIDFDELSSLMKIYENQIESVKKGKASLFEIGTEKYNEVIFSEIDKLQNDKAATLEGMINFCCSKNDKLLVIVLDNCDKRTREDQLLMFDVASWVKDNFPCVVFLPIRDTTYDQYKSHPPLDTVIKDLVFRIDPPLLESVIYSRLNFALREIGGQGGKFIYFLPNGIKVECPRDEVGRYLKSIVSSLFQDNLFKRIITGIAGRNIRKGLEIVLDFCKSGHISEAEILKLRQTDGDYRLPNYLISKTLLKGKRRYYSDDDSHIKNLFDSDSEDNLPDPFVRISILEWLKAKFREYGPNRAKGFHPIHSIIKDLQAFVHSNDRIMIEIGELSGCGCIVSESQSRNIEENDLISISSSGFIHLELLTNISYLSNVSEDTLFRENQTAKKISDNIVGRGFFQAHTRQTEIDNSKNLIEYMDSYLHEHFIGAAKVLSNQNIPLLETIEITKKYVLQVASNDGKFSSTRRNEEHFPPGCQVEAQIVSLQDYGIFVEFGLTSTGLVHKSKFFGVSSLEAMEVGDWLIVEIIQYKDEHKRFELKLVDF